MRAVHYRCIGLFGLVLAASASRAAAQPRIQHDEVGCVSREQFTQFLASIVPPEEIRAAKLYFRSAFYPEFYFVEMSLEDTGAPFQAVLPLPSPETTTIVYYIEAVDLSFQTARSPDFEVSVENSACRPGPGGLLFPGGDPGIVVGATTAGVAALPAGFQAAGVAGFISAAGGVAGGSGIGAGVAIGAAAGAAAGVGVVVAGNGEEEGGNGSPDGSPNVPTTSTAPGTATSTTTTISGSAGPPSSTTTTSISSGPTSTAPPTTTVPSLIACFDWQALGSCQVAFQSCSTPADTIERYEWRMLGPPVPEPPQVESFTFSFAADPRCELGLTFNHPVRLTVYDDLGRSASVQENVAVVASMSLRQPVVENVSLRFTSRIVAMPPDGVTGRIVVNGAPLPPASSGAPTLYEARVTAGTLLLEASPLGRIPPGSLWELDFTRSDPVVPGSLRMETGTLASASDRRFVFRLSGDEGEAIRFRLEVR